MAVYDLEEQEQLEDLKAWWRRWGNIITSVALVIAVAVLGYQGYRYWKQRQTEQASILYTGAMTGLRAKDPAKVKDAVSQLTDRYGSTPYAAAGALLLARMLFDSGDKPGATAQLQWVIDHGDDEMRQIGRFRLAEVQLDAKQYDEALRTLEAKHDDAYAGLYADLRGDVLAAAGRAGDARTAYQAALAKLDAKSAYRGYVQVKLDALGGAPAGAATPAATTPAAPATAPAPAPAK